MRLHAALAGGYWNSVRELSGLILLALALAVLGWGLWRLYGRRRRVHGIRVRLPDDEG